MHPLISCICITRGKPEMLQRAITCFENQTYLFKELVILYEDDDLPTGYFLEHLTPREDIRIIVLSAIHRLTLGELRNTAIEAAMGSLICQWDDDDWYHMDRLERQFKLLQASGRGACVMTRWLIFDNVSGNAYVSNKRRWEGSILCHKDILQLRLYETVVRGEDTAVIDFLYENNHLFEISGDTGMYIYVYHGRNTWNEAHWQNIFRHSNQLSAEEANTIRDILQEKYTPAMSARLIDNMLAENLVAK